MTTKASAVAVILLVTVAVWGAAVSPPASTAEPAPTTTGPFPGATVRVFDTLAPLGATPGESLEDPTGLTGHGTSFPTIVTTYARDNHPVGPSGLSYWNPDCGLFTLYGKTVGFPGGVDINLTGPVQSAPSFAFGDVTFGPGDVWVPGLQEHPLYVHFAGTNRFRTFGTPSRTTPSDARAFGVKVDQRTGNVFVALPADGNLVRVDPTAPQSPGFVATIDWWVGGLGAGPSGVTVDDAGRPYTTLSGEGFDIVVRVDSGPDGVQGTDDDFLTYWQVPNRNGIRSFRTVPAVAPFQEEYPNAILTTDDNGNVWFTESGSNEIGRLSAGPDGVLGSADDVICEYTTPGLANPQQIANTGAGNLLQVYFTEGDGNSVSVLTESEADLAGEPTRVCTTVPAETFASPGFRGGAQFFDEEIEPLQTVIVPTIQRVQGVADAASGGTTTAAGEPIPPILRFSPMPNPLASVDGTPMGDAGNGFPSGMTGVYASNRVAGAYLRGNKHFELESEAVIAPLALTRSLVGSATPPPGGPIIYQLPARMTGSGSLFTAGGTRVRHGFVLRCTDTGARDNTLEVTWGDGNRFHMERLTNGACTDDPSISPNPRHADFDTFTGAGSGRLNGSAGATAEWKFTATGKTKDEGAPGIGDTARIVIRDATGAVVLDVSGPLEQGGHRAHKASKHPAKKVTGNSPTR